jgi:hypothetical protein
VEKSIEFSIGFFYIKLAFGANRLSIELNRNYPYNFMELHRSSMELYKTLWRIPMELHINSMESHMLIFCGEISMRFFCKEIS